MSESEKNLIRQVAEGLSEVLEEIDAARDNGLVPATLWLSKLRSISSLAWQASAEADLLAESSDETPQSLPRGNHRKGRASRRPDYKLGAMLKDSDRRNNNCGAGWLNEDGSIRLVLDPCVVLNGNVADMMYRLFPSDRPTYAASSQRDEELDDF
jgi:hypothetical protein